MQPCEQEINVTKNKKRALWARDKKTRNYIWIGSVCKYIHHTGLVNDVNA